MVFVVLCPEGSTGTVCHAFASALWSHEGERADRLALFVMFIVILLLSHLVSWDRCCT